VQPITADFAYSQIRLALVAVLAYGGGKGWFTPADSSVIVAVASSIGPLVFPYVWSIVSNLGTIKISTKSAAAVVANVEKTDPVSASAGAVAATQAAK
jgi:hypothetical protein